MNREATYIAKVEKENHREVAIAVDIESIHRLNLVTSLWHMGLTTAARLLKLLLCQVLVSKPARQGCHQCAHYDKVK